jgi:hypothetical protein
MHKLASLLSVSHSLLIESDRSLLYKGQFLGIIPGSVKKQER